MWLFCSDLVRVRWGARQCLFWLTRTFDDFEERDAYLIGSENEESKVLEFAILHDKKKRKGKSHLLCVSVCVRDRECEWIGSIWSEIGVQSSCLTNQLSFDNKQKWRK